MDLLDLVQQARDMAQAQAAAPGATTGLSGKLSKILAEFLDPMANTARYAARAPGDQREDLPTGDVVGSALNVGQLLPVGKIAGLAKALAGAEHTPAALASIFGAKSVGWNPVVERAANILEAAGRSPEEIFHATQLTKGLVDKKWRGELSDTGAWLTNKAGDAAMKAASLEPGQKLFAGHLGELLEHPDLYAKYPGKASNEVFFTPKVDSSAWYYLNKAGSGMDIGANQMQGSWGHVTKNSDDILSSMLHEITHNTQKTEGFARGGNPNWFTDLGGDLTPHEQYMRLFGEVEARNVSTRMNMHQDELRRTMPQETWDRLLSEIDKTNMGASR